MRGLTFALAVLLSIPLAAQEPQTPIRIGIYDSRAVAQAYYNSSGYFAQMQTIRKEYDAAKKTNNGKRVAEIDAQMKAHQQMKHTRVFSNASIPDVMETLKETVDRIARASGVRLVVSKWDVGWSDAGVERVDLTDRIVAELKPSAQVQKWLEGLKTQEPLPVERAFHAD
jgi:Skp family chaperone for outer membrane proteins